ncbi:MAG: sigma-70 family RNA polymerase sigma factor [Anaerolineales bacterium]|nr:sigma-70 family RNA polymerase sigma factor [Anaerolineales bacterium]
MNEANDKKQDFSLPALRSGDRAEFARVVDAHSEKIYRLGLKMLHNEQDAEDILQETFIKAYHGFQDFKGKSRISTWLYRIAANEALMLIRKRKNDKQTSLEAARVTAEGEDYTPLNLVDWCCLPEEEYLSAEAINYLDRAVDQLPEAMRVTFILRDIEGLSTRETAQVLEISESAVKTRLSRARLRLRELLSGYYGQKVDTLPVDFNRQGQENLDRT